MKMNDITTVNKLPRQSEIWEVNYRTIFRWKYENKNFLYSFIDYFSNADALKLIEKCRKNEAKIIADFEVNRKPSEICEAMGIPAKSFKNGIYGKGKAHMKLLALAIQSCGESVLKEIVKEHNKIGGKIREHEFVVDSLLTVCNVPKRTLHSWKSIKKNIFYLLSRTDLSVVAQFFNQNNKDEKQLRENLNLHNKKYQEIGVLYYTAHAWAEKPITDYRFLLINMIQNLSESDLKKVVRAIIEDAKETLNKHFKDEKVSYYTDIRTFYVKKDDGLFAVSFNDDEVVLEKTTLTDNEFKKLKSVKQK